MALSADGQFIAFIDRTGRIAMPERMALKGFLQGVEKTSAEPVVIRPGVADKE